MSIKIFEKSRRPSEVGTVHYSCRLRKNLYRSEAVPCDLIRERISCCLMFSAPILLSFLMFAFTSM